MQDQDLLDLLTRFRANDAEAGKRFYKFFAPIILAFFRRHVHDTAAIPDLMQKVFLACWQLDPATVHTSLRGVVMKIAFFKLTRHYRECKDLPVLARDDDGEEFGDHIPDSAPDPEFLLTLSEDFRLIMRALRRLPMKYQALIELSYWQQVPGRELALLFNITEAGIRGRMRLALDSLERTIEKIATSQESLTTTTVTLSEWRERVARWLSERNDRESDPEGVKHDQAPNGREARSGPERP